MLVFLALFLPALLVVNYLSYDIFAQDETKQAYSLSELFKNVEKSVVQISGKDESSAMLGERLGSGFVYDLEGHIVTNNHVTTGSKMLHATFSDGTIYSAKVVSSDPYSDLAVVLVENVPKERLAPLTLGNSSSLTIGQPVAAVGNPFGLSGSLTEGIISGLGRLLPSSQEPIYGNGQVGAFNIPGIIQTDAAINPGNSGGPLLNLNGEVIGINSAIFSNTGVYAGVGFAIPSNTIKKVIPELIAKGSYQHPWIGVTGVDVTPEIADAMNLTEAKGFLVIDVNSNSPADKAGIRGGYKVEIINNTQIRLGGDIIVGIDDIKINNVTDINKYLETKKEGEVVKIAIIREGKPLNISATLEILPEPELPENFKLEPFQDGEPKDFDGFGQGRYLEQLKRECLKHFNDSICNFLFR